MSKSLATAHPLIDRTARALDRVQGDAADLLVPRGKGALEVIVTRGLQKRSLLILDSLIKALEKRGHAVASGMLGLERSGEPLQLTTGKLCTRGLPGLSQGSPHALFPMTLAEIERAEPFRGA